MNAKEYKPPHGGRSTPTACGNGCCVVLNFAFPAIERLRKWQDDACDLLSQLFEDQPRSISQEAQRLYSIKYQ